MSTDIVLLSDKEVWEKNLEKNKEEKVSPSECLISPSAINKSTGMKSCVGTEWVPIQYFHLFSSLLKN